MLLLFNYLYKEGEEGNNKQWLSAVIVYIFIFGALYLFLSYTTGSAAERGAVRESIEDERRQARLREARARQAERLEAEMAAFKQTEEYAQMQRAAAAAAAAAAAGHTSPRVLPEHRGRITRHGTAPNPKPFRPNPASRYGKRGG